MGTDLYVISPLLPLLSEHFHVTLSAAGWGMTLFGLAYAVCAPIFGHHGDRRGRRGPIVGGLLAFTASNAISAIAPNFSIFLIARFVAGGSVAAISPSVYAVIGDIAPPHRRGAWLAFVGSGVFTALFSAAPLGSLIGYRYGWPAVFWLLTAAPFVLAFANWIALNGLPAPHHVASGHGYKSLIADVSVTALWGASLYATYTYVGAGLRTVGGCSPRQVSAAVAVFGVGMMTGALTGGQMSDRFGSRNITIVSSIGAAIAALVFRALMGRFVPSMIGLFLFSYTAALFFPSFQSYLAHKHSHRRGAALAWNNSGLYTGVTSGSFFGGIVLARYGFLGVPVLSSVMSLVTLAWSVVRLERLDRNRA